MMGLPPHYVLSTTLVWMRQQKLLYFWGRGTQLAKLDIKSAYRTVPVHPDDRYLLGMTWQSKTYVDLTLPFGLRSAPKIFNAIADALEWVFRRRGITNTLHYLDDFLFMGPPLSASCAQYLSRAQLTCEELGVPIATEKVEGPSTKIPFLGIELDTESLTLALPAEKLYNLKTMVAGWQGKKSCTKRELLSLIGHLQHACKVVKPGRTFLRRMIDLSTTAQKLHHHIRLNSSFRSDLQWWATFMEQWNGIGMLAALNRQPPTQQLTSDVSGTWGCGAFSGQGWFSLAWSGLWEQVHITIKEFLPIVMASALWGPQWEGQHVECRCDNAAVVAIIRSGTSKHPLAMHLLRALSFFAAHYKFTISATHLPGILNTAADALSRNKMHLFLSLVPQASPRPTPIPPELINLLITQTPDWTSKTWMEQFNSITRKV